MGHLGLVAGTLRGSLYPVCHDLLCVCFTRLHALPSYIPGNESLQQEIAFVAHLVIISAKREGEKRSETQCIENVTSFHQDLLPCEG